MLALFGNLTFASAQVQYPKILTGECFFSYEKEISKFLVVEAQTLEVVDTVSVREAMHSYDNLPSSQKAIKRDELINDMNRPEQ